MLVLRRVLPALVLLLAACDDLKLLPTPVTPRPDREEGVMDGGAPLDTGLVNAPDAGADVDATMGADDAAAPIDAGETDSGVIADGGVAPPDGGVPPVPCGFDVFGAADRERVVLVAEPFTPAPGVPGTTVRALRLTTTGDLIATENRVDVGFRPARIEFVPSGDYALVLGEDGELATVRVRSASELVLVDTVTLPAAGYGDLRILADGQTIVVAGSNVDISSGLSTIALACDGTLTVDTAAFYNLRLTVSLDWIDPAQTRAVVLGGQAVFAPIDNDDLRIFSRANGRWTQVAAFDLWSDHVDAERIAVSPDGRTLLVPNGSPFSSQGGTVMVATIVGDVIGSPRLLPNMGDAREALFSVDGRTALVSLLEAGAVSVLADRGAGFVEVARIRGIGLAEHMAAVERGMLAGLVLVNSVDPQGGPNVARVFIEGPGTVRDRGQTELGMSSAQIPGSLAIQP